MDVFKEAFDELAIKAKERLGGDLVSLIQYGSTARGKAVIGESDADVFAVVRNKKAKEELFDISFEIGLASGILFSVIVRTIEELTLMREMDSIYLREVAKTGKVLYGKAVG
ncbi:MAG: nucleotidyltransferase domain-containing protein [Candidatus Hydrothermarchaeaceae archaeon]